MRVCFPFPGDSLGGSHLSALTLVDELARRGHEITVVVHSDGPLGAHLRERGTEFVELPSRSVLACGTRSGMAQVVLRAPKFAAWLRRRQIDVVHTNDLRAFRAWMLAAKLGGRPHVTHQRTEMISPRWGQQLLRLPERVIAISDYVVSTLPRWVAPRTSVIPNPFDTHSAPPSRQEARDALLAELGLPEQTPLVGFAGNLANQKRPLVFCRAGAKLRTRPAAHLILIGRDRDGLAPSLVEWARAAGMTDRLHFLGFRSPIEPVLAGLDVLLAPAVNEGQGRVLVEAALVGTPVVAASSGGHPEVVADGRTGLLVPPDDVEALAEAAEQILGDPTGAVRLADAAQVEARRRFGVAAHADAVEDVYRSLLEDGRADASTVTADTVDPRSPGVSR